MVEFRTCSRISPMILAGILMLVIPRFPVAQDLPAPLKECRLEKNDALRLACYDREVDARAQSPTAGTAPPASVPVSTPGTPEERFGYENVRDLERRDQNRGASPEPDELVAKVAEVSRPTGGVFVITLEIGQVWKQNSPDPYFLVRTGEQVTIKRAALGSFMMSGKSWWSTRVSRVR